jgi:Tol biopolymer transport system component
MKRVVLLLAFLSVVSGGALQAQTRGATAEDYYAFETLGEPHFSPDGATIAFVVTTVDQKQNRRRSVIYSVPADGGREPQALTDAVRSSNTPRWRPDGKALAFLSARPAPGDDNPRPQVWLLPLSGGEPQRLTNLPNGVTAFQWAPDGARLVVVSRSGPSDTAKSPSDVRHYRHANYKFNDSGWFDDKRAHLWVVEAASAQATQLTSGDDWNDADPQWSPDSRKIAFVSDRTGKAFDEGHNTDVWVIDANGGPLTKSRITRKATTRRAGRPTDRRSRS